MGIQGMLEGTRCAGLCITFKSIAGSVICATEHIIEGQMIKGNLIAGPGLMHERVQMQLIAYQSQVDGDGQQSTAAQGAIDRNP